MQPKIQILFVADNTQEIKRMAMQLEDAGLHFDWEWAQTEQTFLGKLRPDIGAIVADGSMLRFSAFRALELSKYRHPNIPFIMISDSSHEAMVVSAIRHGASDFISKNNINRLPSSISDAIEDADRRLKRSQTEPQCIDVQKIEFIQSLSGNIAHDLSDMLGVVIGYGDILRLGLEEGSPLCKYVDGICNVTERAVMLTQPLLQFASKKTSDWIGRQPSYSIDQKDVQKSFN